MAERNENFGNLGAGGRLVATVALRTRVTVYALLGTGVCFSWLLLVLMAARSAMISGPGPAGPGADALQLLSELPWPAFFDRLVGLCLGAAVQDAAYAGRFAVLTSMWFLMAIAMMLPSAAPMIRTYCEIADTAMGKGECVVHPAVLVGGYLIVWLAASLGFAFLTYVAQAMTGSAVAPLRGVAAAAALAIAGLYQFSGLKEACLRKCRNPFNILFARWSVRPSRIFVLGLEQGLWCLGCCWALMLVMFAVGIMNLFWMALIGLFTVVEKQVSGRIPSLVVGGILLVWATMLLLSQAL
jgi:predicted metal-binding membrane protein